MAHVLRGGWDSLVEVNEPDCLPTFQTEDTDSPQMNDERLLFRVNKLQKPQGLN